MNGQGFRWAWFGLVCAVVVFTIWATRFEFLDCGDYGCYVGDRWTGEVCFQGEEVEPTPPTVVNQQFH